MSHFAGSEVCFAFDSDEFPMGSCVCSASSPVDGDATDSLCPAVGSVVASSQSGCLCFSSASGQRYDSRYNFPIRSFVHSAVSTFVRSQATLRSLARSPVSFPSPETFHMKNGNLVSRAWTDVAPDPLRDLPSSLSSLEPKWTCLSEEVFGCDKGSFPSEPGDSCSSGSCCC